MKIIAANNPNPAVRQSSSAGGVFSMLAEHVVNAGGVVIGVAFDESWHIVHKVAELIEDLPQFRGSKYAFSEMGTMVRDVRSYLEDGKKVLFSGTPCQVAAMRIMAGEDDNLITVEVVCHGAPEQKYWNRYIDELCSKYNRKRTDIEYINFRDKRTGWKNYSFVVRFKDGKEIVQHRDDNLYMRAFTHSNHTLRKACFGCKFKFPNNKGDIILGDFWGISSIDPSIDNDLGTTIVICTTQRGVEFCSQVLKMSSGCDYSFEEIAETNPALTTPPSIPNNYDQFLKSVVSSNSLLRVLKKYADKSLYEKIYLSLAKAKHRLLSRL